MKPIKCKVDNGIISGLPSNMNGKVVTVVEDAIPPNLLSAIETSSSDMQLAQMILSDCGCSENNQLLLNRVAKRITKYVDALIE